MSAGTVRAVGLVEATAGALVSARTSTLLHAVDGGVPATTPAIALGRLLGARMLAQGVLAAASPSRRVALGGAATDLSHALSMLPVAARLTTYRRPAVVSATVAVGFAVAQLAAARPRRPVLEGARP